MKVFWYCGYLRQVTLIWLKEGDNADFRVGMQGGSPVLDCYLGPCKPVRRKRMVFSDPPEKVELTEVLQALRKDLAGAMEAGKGQPLGFDVNHIEVELCTVIEKSDEIQTEGKGTLKFFVEIGAAVRGSERNTSSRIHRIRLQLTPVLPEQESTPERSQKIRLSAQR